MARLAGAGKACSCAVYLGFRIDASEGNTARVAVAREMLKIIYSMLANNRPFVKE